MTIKLNAYKVCHHCHGSGEVPAYVDPLNPPTATTVCPECDGVGEILVELVDHSTVVERCDDILGRCSDIMNKCNDIFEKVSE